MNKVENGSYSSRVRYLRHQHMISREIESYQEVLRETANGNYNSVITVAGRKFIEVQLDSMLDWYWSNQRIENTLDALEHECFEYEVQLMEWYRELDTRDSEELDAFKKVEVQHNDLHSWLYA